MANHIYTDKQQEDFIELALEAGIGPTMRELGYPKHYATAQKWFESRGIEITVDILKRRAAQIGQFYGAAERMLAAQDVMDRIVAAAIEDDLSAEEINKLANALQRVVQTMQLIEGNVTDRRETISKDGTDLALQDLINEAKARNALKEQEIKDSNG